MSLYDTLKPIIAILPEVKAPDFPPSLKDKLLWTFLVLALFFILGQIYPIGIDASRLQQFERLDILLGSKTGTLITAGIGPIVLASIFLQLAKGSGLLNIDFSNPNDRKAFQGLQKLLAIVLSFAEGFIYVFSNYITAAGAGASTAIPLFGSVFATQLIVGLQLAMGSLILLYLDEIVQKYGIGSGISLFIAAGVSQAIFLGAFSLVPSVSGIPSGLIPQAIYLLTTGDVIKAFWAVIPIVFTIAIFLAVVYVEGMKIELPLAYGKARGLGARYPIKFLYVSNIPVILASAVLLNMQLIGLFMFNAGLPLLGTYQNNQPVDGLAYFVTALPSPLLIGGYDVYLQYLLQPREIFHALTYGIALVLLCIVFGWFWIESTGMGSADVARQLEKSGLQIPGFRQDTRVTERILSKYIPIITILGSAFVGVLAWFADITGALGTGTGLLLTVGIIYKFYEDLAQQQLFELYPGLRNIVQ
ncbi:preprotein translocase subunit SecY [Candidatus Micrarchaeota archaeon]|nr:preprotein translocase subunit SecY [Candidatus Micrarchaeota archaeon]